MKAKTVHVRKRRFKPPRPPSGPFNGHKVNYTNVPSNFFTHSFSSGPPPTDSGVIRLTGSAWNAVQSTFDGTQNPYWKSQVKAGQNATTNCSGVKRSLDLQYFHGAVQSFFQKPNKLPFGQEWFGYPDLPGIFGNDSSVPSASMVTNVTNRAIAKFLERTESARSSIEAGQDLGEYRETIRGLLHPLKSLREFTLSHLSRVLKLSKQVQHKKALSKMVADTWLEYRFGWRPLALDISQAYADVMNNHHFAVVPIRASAHDTFPIVATTTSNMSQINGDASCKITRRVTGEYSITYKGAVRTGAVNGQIGLQQNLQLDLPHFLPTIWDLLPYSWIVDYFTNVGDIIRSLSLGTANVVWLCKTIRTTVNYEYSCGSLIINTDPTIQPTIMIENPSCTPSASTVSFSRSAVNPSTLVPTLHFTVPLAERPWENLTALFVGRQQEISRVAKHLR